MITIDYNFSSQVDIKKGSQALDALLARDDLGFLKLPERMENWHSSAKRGQELGKKYKTLVIVGMGGSSLGVRALADYEGRGAGRLEFLDNLDGRSLENFLKSIEEPQSRHYLFISKSGGTLETLALLDRLSEHYSKNSWSLAEHSTVISEKKESSLTLWARKFGVPECTIPDDVGGRFSVLTPVGLVPGAFLGLDIEEIRQGAIHARELKSEIAGLVDQALASFGRGEWVTYLWAYSESLKSLMDWTQQLWAESLGKAKDLEGKAAPRVSVPVPCLGPRDQHSILQQVSVSRGQAYVWFFRDSQSEVGEIGKILTAQADATAGSLFEDQVQSLSINLEYSSAAGIGALFMLLELVVGSLGEALGINAYDQPGVEAGKKLTLDKMAAERGKS